MSDSSIISNFSNLAEIDPRLPTIGTSWLYSMPFFYTYFANTTFEKTDMAEAYCGIAPHENSFKIIIGKLFNDCPSLKKIEGALIHEYLHVIMETFERQGERDTFQWNVATDYAINEEVLKHKYNERNLELPDMVLLFKDLQAYGYKGACVAEEIYDFLSEEVKNNPQQGDGSGGGKDGDSQGQKSQQSTGPDGKKNFDSHEGLDKLKEAIRNNPITAAKVKKIFEEAKAQQELQSKGIGSNAGSIYEFIDSISRPTVRWRSLLHATVQSHVKGSGHKVYNWGKKNRRNLPFPGKKRYNKKIVLAVDTSGSIDLKLAGRFFAEIDKISQDNEITLIQFDYEVQKIDSYKKGDWRKLKFTGRGGTSLKDLFDKVSKNKKLNNTTIVVFSDGGFCKDYDVHGLDVIFCIAGDISACVGGKIITIKDF